MRQSSKSYVVKSKNVEVMVETGDKVRLDQGTINRIAAILMRGNDAQVRQKKDKIDVYELTVSKL